MKLILLICAFVATLGAQNKTQPVVVGSPPIGGVCVAGSPFYANLQTGALVTCQAGLWAQISGGGGGGTGTVTHSVGALTSNYAVFGNGAGDIRVYGMYLDGSSVLQNPAGFGTTGATASGYTQYGGSTSGVVTVTVAAAAGTYSLTLPATGGTTGYSVVSTDGAGTLGYALELPDTGANGFVKRTGAGTTAAVSTARAFGYTFNGAGTALTSGQTGYLTVPFACTISAWNMSVDTGTATVDVWKIATGTGIPTISNTITASATPAIASNNSLHSTTLTGWTTAVAANDIVGINLKATASATVVNLTVECDQ